MKILTTMISVTALFLLAGFLLMIARPASSCCTRSTSERQPVDETPVTLTSTTLEIGGMTCAACETSVRRTLKKLHGVQMVSFNKDRASVLYDPAKVTPQKITDAVNKLGFRASLVTPEERS